jgi:hypothetical protein
MHDRLDLSFSGHDFVADSGEKEEQHFSVRFIVIYD